MKQLSFVWVSPTERLAQAARERIARGLVDEWGRLCPDGPRKELSPAQRRAYDEYQAQFGTAIDTG